MVREKISFQFIYFFLALLGTVIFSVWAIDQAVADSVELVAPSTQGSALLMSTNSYSGAFVPVLKADKNGRLLLAYNHNIGTIENPKYKPFFRKSTDGGDTWSAPAAIQHSGKSLLEVTFDFDSNNVAHAVWRTQYELWHASENGWPSSTNSHQIASNTGELVFSPDIAIAPDNTLHVVWRQGYKIFHSYSKNAGKNWTNPYALTTADRLSEVPAIDVDNDGNVHVVWQERLNQNFKREIRYLKGTMTGPGVNWDSNYSLLSSGIPDAWMPEIHIDGNRIHVSFAYKEKSYVQYAYYVSKTLNSSWSTPQDITQGDPLIMNTNIPFVLMPSMDSCGQDVFVVFHGALEENHSERILSVESGDDWSTRSQVTTGAERSIRPSLTCIGGKLHVAYEIIITPDKNHQIYYISGLANAVYLPAILSP